MLDINFIRNYPDVVKKAVANKLMDVGIDRLLEVDRQIRERIKKVDLLRAERNNLSKQIPTMNEVTRNTAVEKVKAIKGKLSDLEVCIMKY